jgi:hypothetical protein
LVRRNLKKHMLLTRIENVAGPGVPDVYWTSLNGDNSGWIELKIIRGRKTRFGQEQVAWIKRHADLGVNVCILARKDDTILLWYGSKVAQVALHGLDIEAAGTWDRPYPWKEIVERIMVGDRQAL